MKWIARLAKTQNVHVRKGHEVAYPSGKVKTLRSINAAKKLTRAIQQQGYVLGVGDNRRDVKVGGKGLGMGDVRVVV